MLHTHPPQNTERIRAFCQSAGVEYCWRAALIHVERILIEYGKATPPYDAWEICALRGIEVQTTYLDGCDARLLPVRGGYIAEVHSEHSRGRQSFSLCHELGHTLFDDASRGRVECDSSTFGCRDKLEESICDFIASELLMPRDIFAAEVGKRIPSWNEVCGLAGTFQVSKEAAINRIRGLDLWECVYVTLGPIVMKGDLETFALKSVHPCRSLEQHPIGTAYLVYRVIEWLHSEKQPIFRTEGPSEVDLGLSTHVLLSGQYFSVGGMRFARLLVVKSQPSSILGSGTRMKCGEQLSLFNGRQEN